VGLFCAEPTLVDEEKVKVHTETRDLKD